MAMTKNGSGSLRVSPSDGDLVLLHRLEQRALRLRRGAVHLVGEDHLGEDRPGVELEAAAVALVDRHADDVGGQHVAGELDALEMQAERAREHVRERGLADAGQVLDQQVAAREQAGQRQPHLRFLAEDDLLAASMTRSIGGRRPTAAGTLRCQQHEPPLYLMRYDSNDLWRPRSSPIADCLKHDMGAQPSGAPAAAGRDRGPPDRLGLGPAPRAPRGAARHRLEQLARGASRSSTCGRSATRRRRPARVHLDPDTAMNPHTPATRRCAPPAPPCWPPTW